MSIFYFLDFIAFLLITFTYMISFCLSYGIATAPVTAAPTPAPTADVSSNLSPSLAPVAAASSTKAPTVPVKDDKNTTTVTNEDKVDDKDDKQGDDETPQAGVYAVVYESVFVNLLSDAPSRKAQAAIQEHAETDVDELERVTAEHILNHVRSVTDDPKLVVAVLAKATLVSVAVSPWKNATMVTSHSITGSVQFHVSYGRPRADAINKIVQEAFDGAAAVQYEKALQTSSDVILKRTESVFVGLPSEILPTTSTTYGTVDGEENEEWMQWGDWEDTDFIILVAVGGAAALLTFGYTAARLTGVVGGPKKKDGGDAGKKPPIVEKANSSETAPLSPMSKDSNMATPDHLEFGDRAPGNSMLAVIGEDGQAVEQDADDIESSRCDISEVTSVYSYLDSKSIDVDDQGYSVKDAYNANISGDEESGSWSVDPEGSVLGARSSAVIRASSIHTGTAPTAEPFDEEKANAVPTSTTLIVKQTARAASPNGPMIFSDNSDVSGGMDSSAIDDSIKDTPAAPPTKSLVASAVARFEAAASKSSAEGSPAKTVSSFPDRIDSSILMLAPESPKSAPVSPAKKKEETILESPTDSIKGKTLDYAETGTGSVGDGETERPSLPAVASNQSRHSGSAASSNKQGSQSTVPTTISVQNSSKSDESKRSSQSDRPQPSASFILRSKSTDQEEMNRPPASVIRVLGVANDKDSKAPTASYIMRAKSWGSRTNFGADTGEAAAPTAAVNRQPVNDVTKKAFPFKGFGASKASQMALNPAGHIQELAAVRSSNSTLSENHSLLESDSDIQSLCSMDNHSLFSFGGKNLPGGNSMLDMQGSSPYMQGTGLSDDDEDSD